jgi:hypothetical protein
MSKAAAPGAENQENRAQERTNHQSLVDTEILTHICERYIEMFAGIVEIWKLQVEIQAEGTRRVRFDGLHKTQGLKFFQSLWWGENKERVCVWYLAAVHVWFTRPQL